MVQRVKLLSEAGIPYERRFECQLLHFLQLPVNGLQMNNLLYNKHCPLSTMPAYSAQAVSTG